LIEAGGYDGHADYWVHISRSPRLQAGVDGHSSNPCFPSHLLVSASPRQQKEGGQEADETPAVLVLTDFGL